MENTVVIFSMTGCLHCKSLKKRLDENTIEYIDIDVDRNPEIWSSVKAQTKLNLVPTIFIKKPNSDDGPVFVPSRDYQTEDELVEIIQKYVKK